MEISEHIVTLIKENPERARGLLRAAFGTAGAHQGIAAESFHVTAPTFSRWVHALDLHEEFKATRKRATAEGWAESRGQGERGPDVQPRASRKRADARARRGRS